MMYGNAKSFKLYLTFIGVTNMCMQGLAIKIQFKADSYQYDYFALIHIIVSNKRKLHRKVIHKTNHLSSSNTINFNDLISIMCRKDKDMYIPTKLKT